ncbi:hypothetical protein QJQ45_009877 [Haematococcus lacustris]|nr:hypothetical protein QJQ45_005432 [Haematococcus lacustris]KAJ9526399.1 hypothetical protein QJQ45_009877 [Haematococcus lacustris]
MARKSRKGTAKQTQGPTEKWKAASPSSSNNSPAAAPCEATVAALVLRFLRISKATAEQHQSVFDPATPIGVEIDLGVTQAVSAASERLRQCGNEPTSPPYLEGNAPARQFGLTACYLLAQAHLAQCYKWDHSAAASSAGTSLEANLKHITVTLATWDVVWEVYLDPKWARQRLRLYGAQARRSSSRQAGETLEKEKEMEELSMERHGRAKQLVVFFGAAGTSTEGGGKDQRQGRVVLVDEHRTTRVSSAVNGQQSCEVELNTLSATRPAGWRPPAGQVEERLVRPAWSQERGQPVRGLVWCPVVAPRKPPQAPCSSQAATQPAASEPGPRTFLPAKRGKRIKAEQTAEPTQPAEAKPAPQPGRWLDRDCNAALNMQRIGESRWRALELCWWPHQAALLARGKEYPGLSCKRLRDKPPKASSSSSLLRHSSVCPLLELSPAYITSLHHSPNGTPSTGSSADRVDKPGQRFAIAVTTVSLV